jgi:hypothetical protein
VHNLNYYAAKLIKIYDKHTLIAEILVILHTISNEYTGIRESLCQVAAGIGLGAGNGEIFGKDDFPRRLVGFQCSDALQQSVVKVQESLAFYPTGC